MLRVSIEEGIRIILIIEYRLMNAIRNRLYLVSVGLLALLSFTACSYSFFIKATGNLNQQIVFEFHKSTSDAKPSKFDILDFTVQKQSGDGQWITVWDINGKQSLSAIEYGKKYKGFTETTPAKVLSKEAQYRAFASGTTWPDAGIGRTGINFHFDRDGNLVQSGAK